MTEEKQIRVRWYPADSNETFDGTVIEERPNSYLVAPDQNIQLTQHWSKSRCEIISPKNQCLNQSK